MSNVPLILPTTSAPPVEAIHEVELLYHVYVIQQVQIIPQIQDQIQQLQTQIIAIGGARDSWMTHLSQRYQLMQGDQITSDGQIVRANPPEIGGD